MKLNLSGSIVALVTPFKNNKVDYVRLKKLIDFQIKGGTSAIVPCGTTGESPTLSHEEHKKVIAQTVKFVNGRVPVIAGTGSNSTDEAIMLTQHAKKVGADASLSVVPYYNKPTQKGLYDHYKAIATKSKLPIVLYNIPGRTGVGMTVDTVVALSKVDYIVAIKEATGSMDMASEILNSCDLTVLSGDDSLTLPLLTLGAKGVISVFANIFPKELSNMLRTFSYGDLDEARKMHYRMLKLCKALFVETNPIPIKQAMKLMKLDSGEVRAPLSAMDPKNLLKVKKQLMAYKKVVGSAS